MRRNDLDICAYILRIAKQGGKKTHLVYQAIARARVRDMVDRRFSRATLSKCAEVIERITSHILSRLRILLPYVLHILTFVRHTPMRVRKIFTRHQTRERAGMLDFKEYKKTYRTRIEKRDRRKRSRLKALKDTKYIIPVLLSVTSFFVFSNILLPQFFFKPNVGITSIQYDIEYSEYECHQVFTGHIANTGKANAYDVEVFVMWGEMGGGSHTDSTYLGKIPPGGVHHFNIEFNVPDAILILYYTRWVDFASRPS